MRKLSEVMATESKLFSNIEKFELLKDKHPFIAKRIAGKSRKMAKRYYKKYNQ